MISIFDDLDRVFLWNIPWEKRIIIPDGYKLVEDSDHRKKRVETSISATKNMISYHEEQVKRLQDKLSNEEKELSEL